VTLGIRSEDIAVGPGGAAAARVHHVENHGVEKIVTLRAGESLFKATVPAVAPIAVEDTVRFSFNQNKLHGFDPASGRNRVAPG
jgi:multiple sugar transport system ATP-binding protein